ncbi:MFS transporter [Terracoccus sp. 273MFTsu3.1]|uniref:MFS transporter n=1 Tax=Terracoccus sp. 273MFTsu3.1 TaxID=1172188 RepID=UPI00036E63BC|nr:MFS transporter [Terracoccus sp. 273MFTsu3.1]
MSDSTAVSDAARAVARSPITKVVGFLICVELASGVLQGYYTPIFTDIARHLSIKDADVNWFEAAQLIVSALVVPLLARLGDLIGHRKVLLLSTVVTAAASWGVAFAPSFGLFLVAWAIQGFYVVWLPMEVAIIHRRTGGSERRVRGAAGLLVAGLELGVIAGALTSGALAESLGMTALLALPAVVVTLALVAIWFGVEESPVLAHGTVDWRGFWLITLALGLVMGGLVTLRVLGPGSPWPWVLVLLGAAAFVPFARVELAHPEPLVDLRILGARGQWPVQATAFLFGVSVLGAQIPLSTFARTDPAVTGYGLGASAGKVSIIIGGYVLSLAVGALLLHLLAHRTGTRVAMVVAAVLVAVGYLLFLPFHDTLAQTMTNMVIAGLGSGALVAGLPTAAAAQAPPTHTGLTTGMTNTTKTIGGAFASSVFAIALSSTGTVDAEATAHASLSGYLTVWAICGVTALVAAVFLAVVRPAGDRPAVAVPG